MRDDKLMPVSFTEGFRTFAASTAQTTPKLASFAFSEVTYNSPAAAGRGRRRRCFWQKTPPAAPPPPPLLCDAYGHSQTNEVLAVLGPSAEARTALLLVLGGRHHAVRNLQSGIFTANETEEDLFPVVRAAFVPREPQHVKTSTVEEELRFACELRMPGSGAASSAVRQTLLADLMSSMDLDPQARIKALLPHELKRLAIAVELVSLPNLLLVDQPLTGDRKRDWETIEILQTIARLGICQVVVSLDAPLPEIFKAVSRHFLLLSAQGSTMSVGTVDQAVQYVESTGRRQSSSSQEESVSSGDFLLLCAEYAKGTWRRPTEGKSAPSSPPPAAGAPLRAPLRSQWTQFSWLMQREVRYVAREWRWLVFRALIVGLLLAIMAVMFTNGGLQQPAGGKPYNFGAHLGSFIFPLLILNMSCAFPTAMILFVYKKVVLREQVGATYALAPAFACKMISEFVITFVVQVAGVAVCRQSIGWGADYLTFVGLFFLMALSCCSYGYFFALTVNGNMGALIALLGVCLGPQILFLGLVQRYAMMPAYLAWVHYVCNLAWGMRAVMGIELDPEACTSPFICAVWSMVKAQNYVESQDVWQYCLVLAAFFVFYRALALALFARKVRASL